MPRRPVARPRETVVVPPGTVPVNPLLARLVQAINREHGAGAVTLMSDAIETVSHTLDVGLPTLHHALDLPGWPLAGKIVEIYGPESVGKTYLCKYLAARAQQAGVTVAFNDQEDSIGADPAFDQAIGLDPANLLLSRPPEVRTIEDSFDLMTTFVKVHAGAHAQGLFFWDSIAATPSKVESETDLEAAARPGARAAAMSRGFVRVMPELRNTGVGLILVNQERERIGAAPFQEKTYSPGGRALRHFAHVRIQAHRVGNIKRGEETIGIRTNLRIRKNKLGPPLREAELSLFFDGHVEESSEDA